MQNQSSTANRCETELRDIYDILFVELSRYFNDDGTRIVEFNILAPYLSLVRDQSVTGTCTYVHAVAGTEMVYRICGRNVRGPGAQFFFDIQDCFDNLYKKLPNIQNAAEKLCYTMGERGTRVLYILKYINSIGLLVSSACTNPQERNLDAEFIQTTERKKLNWFERLGGDKVIKCLRTDPLLAVMYSHTSFKRCREVVYTGPTMEDIAVPLDKRRFHTVLLVGSFKLRMENSERVFVIAQNSHGTDFGFKGYVVIPFDIPDLFLEFWLPMLRPEMDEYVDHNRHPQIAGSKRKRA